MTTSKSEPLQVPLSEAAQQALQQAIAQSTAPEPAAVTEARDKLLAAIGTEAANVVAEHPGAASKALAELAHAFTLTTSATPTTRLGGSHTIDLIVEFNNKELTLTPQLVVGEAESDVNFRAPLRLPRVLFTVRDAYNSELDVSRPQPHA
ncbi:hypothetical protein ACWGR4_30335 [Embleya sp. NPDC055664]